MIETIMRRRMKHWRQGHRATTRKSNLLSETSFLNGEVVVAIEIESHTLLQIDVGYVPGLALLGGEALAGAQPRD
nr:hypothetical protein CFP56_49806 [Quercus suber]